MKKSLATTSSKRKAEWISSSFGGTDDLCEELSTKQIKPVESITTNVKDVKTMLPYISSGELTDGGDEEPLIGLDSVTDIVKDMFKRKITLLDIIKNESSEQMSWIEKYKPLCEYDLAIHKKKIADVKQWLENHLHSKNNKIPTNDFLIRKSYYAVDNLVFKRAVRIPMGIDQSDVGILLLSGPSGSGKTAIMQVLSNELRYKIKEWINPVGQDYQEKPPSGQWRDFYSQQDSQSQQFSDFLLRANRYKGLSMIGDDQEECSNKVVLIEDLPNFVLRDPKKLHSILKLYKMTGRSPLVFVISDSHNTDSTVYNIFPKNIQNELGIVNLSFNAVAATSLKKAMTKIVCDQMEVGSNIITPSKDTYDLLAASSNGDIRSCINALQFFCTNCNPESLNSKKKTSTKSKRSVKTTKKINTHEEDSVACIGGRDHSLFLFRALGKILYCKRAALKKSERLSLLPLHMNHLRRNVLQIDPEIGSIGLIVYFGTNPSVLGISALWRSIMITNTSDSARNIITHGKDVFERTQITSDTFLLYLHQNYPEFYTNIDDISSASLYVTDADVMAGVWSTRNIMSDYSSSISMRGIMFSNSSTGAVSSGWRPLHKPMWFESFKMRNSRKRTANDLFREKRYSALDFYTEVLPSLQQINIPLKTPGHHSFVEEVSTFPINKQNYRPHLQTMADDVTDDVVGINSEPYGGVYLSRMCNEEINLDDLIEDDDIIEEFDD